MKDAFLRAMQTLLRRATSRTAFIVLSLLVVVALGAGLLAPYDPRMQIDVTGLKNHPPSLAHWFGTDSYSRDVLSRVIYGARTSLSVAGVSVIVALLIGTAVGSLAGYAGGRTDRWLMRIVDGVLAVPRLLVLLVIAALFRQFSVFGLSLVIGLTAWPGMSRVVRQQVRDVAALDYVLAARALGVRSSRILFRHVLPAVAPQILVVATLAVATVIPLEAGLSYLGLGVEIPISSWGGTLLDGYEQHFAAWWLIVFPGAAIVITVLAVNVIGDTLREVFDPRLRPPL